jgi:hypothetical protein
VLALKLLGQWLKRIDFVRSFEDLAARADGLVSLKLWAKHLGCIPEPLASPAAEDALFEVEIGQLSGLDTIDDLARQLGERLAGYERHASAFWGSVAKSKVRWGHLVEMASVASELHRQAGVESGWKRAEDAVAWFAQSGWKADRAGESLFREDPTIPGGLVGVRAKLRRGYLRHLDRTNSAFSELLSHAGPEAVPLPFAGDAIKDVVAKASAKEPIAVLVLDACRFDLGCRLAEQLNQGEPCQRAEVSAAKAPLPSMTALGMAFCVPGVADKLHVQLTSGDPPTWRAVVEGFKGDLTQAAQRREWLKCTYKLKSEAMLSVKQVVNQNTVEPLSSKALGKLVFVFGDEFDVDGHDCRLEISGCDDHIERYARCVRVLRNAGYATIAVVTDHGFFHWEPAEDEVEAKPTGEVQWQSRRAVVGHGLEHPTALPLSVSASDLECRVPRSVNAFKTYGGLGYFHGGATLQELVIPVVIARWPKKTAKIGVVLKPVSQISSMTQRIEVEPAAQSKPDMFGELDAKLTARHVQAKVMHPSSGKVLFRSKDAVAVEPGGAAKTLELNKVEGAEGKTNDELDLVIVDADDEEILDRGKVTLKIDIDEWF